MRIIPAGRGDQRFAQSGRHGQYLSRSGTVAAAIEWYQDGLLTDADTDGLALNWGDREAILAPGQGDDRP
jgi:hypothetical protein